MGNGHTVKIKRSVKVRVINELESYPSIINEIKPDIIAQTVVRKIERMVEMGQY